MQFTVAQIAALANGTIEGDSSAQINSFAKIEEGHQGAISFLANPKYTHYLYDTASTAVLVSKDLELEHPVKCTLIRVDDPYATVASLMQIASQMLQPKPVGVEHPSFIAEGVEVPDDAYIGAFAYIAKGVKLGKGVKIYPHAYIGDNVKIGDNATIYSNVSIYYNCIVGNNCILHSGCVLGADGFGFAPVDGHYNKIPQLGNVVLEDDVEIGANTTIDRAMMGSTVIGRGTKLDNLIQIAHNCQIGQNNVFAAQLGVAGSTKIGNQCMFGGQVGIAGHIEIGDNVQIGAQTGIPNNVKSNSRLMGYPGVDVSQFARQTVYIKKLPDLNARVNKIEKTLNDLEKQA